MKRKLLLIVALFVAISTISAQEFKYTRQTKRPKVGVVLGGGGAKGAAHIGVLRLLEELDIPIDYISGTSMGAIIGGLYSIGYDSDELTVLIGNMDWPFYMSNNVDRVELSYELKEYDSKYLLTIPFNAIDTLSKIKDKTFISSLPSGFISGQNLYNLFNSLCVGYQDSLDFHKFPIPFACVAVDAISGKAIVMDKGVMPLAMRASMAIPGVFSPIKMDNMVLVDGGLVDNFPVSVCADMGADIIIGVEVGSSEVATAETINSLPELVSQLLGVTLSGDNQAKREKCDFYFHPNMNGYGTMSFDKTSIDTLIQRGYNEALKEKERFLELKQYLDKFGKPKPQNIPERAKNIRNDSILISSIQMNGIDNRDSNWLLKKTSLLSNKYVSAQEIDEAISIFYGTKSFSSVTYQILGRYAPYSLVINFVPAQPHKIGLGLRFDSEESAAVLVNLGLNTQRLRGVKLDLSGRLSYNPFVEGIVSYIPRNIPKVALSYRFKSSDLNYYTPGNDYFNSRYNQNIIKLYLSETYSRIYNVNFGIKYEDFRFNRLIINPPEGVAHNSKIGRYLSTILSVDMDTQDKAYYPTRGIKFNIQGEWYFSDFSGTAFTNMGVAKLSLSTSFTPIPRLSIIPSFTGRLLIGPEIPAPLSNVIGGYIPSRYLDQQIPFVGTTKPHFMNNSIAIMRLDCRVKTFKDQYVTACFNYGTSAIDPSQFFLPGSDFLGAALIYSYDSFIGPIDLHFHWSNFRNQNRKFGVYFNLGYYF